MLLELIQLSLAVATLSVTVTRATIFKPLRAWVEARNAWLGELIHCFYCFNHWAAALMLPVLPYETPLKTVITWLAIVALASLISGQLIRFFNGVEQSAELKNLQEEVGQLHLSLSAARTKIEELSRRKR